MPTKERQRAKAAKITKIWNPNPLMPAILFHFLFKQTSAAHSSFISSYLLSNCHLPSLRLSFRVQQHTMVLIDLMVCFFSLFS